MDYNKITIAKYKEIQEIVNNYMDSPDGGNMEELNLKIDLISVLFDLTKQEIYGMKATDFNAMCDKLSFLLEKPKVNGNIPRRIIVNGKPYKVMKKIDKFTTGQFIDLNNYISSEAGLEYILSTILIPDDKKGYTEGYELDDVLYDMECVDILTALNLNAFFLKKLQVYSERFRTYLGLMTMWKTRKLPKEMRKKTRKEVMRLLLEGNGNTYV